MINHDRTIATDRPPYGEAVAVPVAHQGVLDALRKAYRTPADDIPEDMRLLLNRLR